MNDYIYTGDVNIEYGGAFISVDDDEWRYGYCSAVRITDLDSGCGFTGAILVEKITINGTDNRKRKRDAIKCTFGSVAEFRNALRRRKGSREHGERRQSYRLAIADALMSYGFYDPDNDDYTQPHSVIIQTQEDGPMSFDGWKATERITKKLREYIEATFC